jgi:hypothetical protein
LDFFSFVSEWANLSTMSSCSLSAT